MPIPQLRDHPDYYSQKKDLVNTFDKFREYKLIHSQVLPDCIKRVKLAFDRWFKADKNGQRLGKPRFSCQSRKCWSENLSFESERIPAKIAQIVVKKSPKNYPKEFPNCEDCGIVIDRDVNPGINIKNRALRH